MTSASISAPSCGPKAVADILGARFRSLSPGGLVTIIGADTATLGSHLPPGAPNLLALDLNGVAGHEAAIARVLDDLAALALRSWPAWPEPTLASWGRAAGRLAATGRAPRFRNIAQETQLAELVAAAGAPAIIFPLDPVRRERAAPIVAALEWCRRRGAVVVALLPEAPPAEPPWDRILHDALTLSSAPLPVDARLIVPSLARRPSGSAIEKRMREALAGDRELAGLFDDEVTLRLGPLGPTPRVDLLWRGGKVVVELDGDEHERDSNYGDDRHRDYELLVAGYLVLRLTNREVALDLARSLDKVRRVVKLRRGSA